MLPRRRKPWLLMAAPALLLAGVGGWLWLGQTGSVSTDNAYVQQDRVSISADVTGRVEQVLVRESQPVQRGQVIIRLADEPFRIALAEAEARLASARLQVAELTTGTTGRRADVDARRDAVRFAAQELDRQQKLVADGFATRARLQAAESALTQAQAALASALADEAGAAARANVALRGTHPLILAAQAARDRAAFDLSRTIIKAPADGIATQTTKVLPGQVMATGIPTMAIMLGANPYVEANFKETDLEPMRPGQTAEIVLDAYPGSPLRGRVESIGAGTGSEFSVLPAQNATGNWVKVVQRVPVRIALVGPPTVPLIAGLSATVTIDTSR
ncbi:membrane protein [Polymorphobacter multimanifer]|nr:membrane protein [Polymorphobacter multimanifer]